MRFEEFQECIFKGNLMTESLDLKISFTHLQHIELQVVTVQDASILLSELSHKSLQTLSLYITIINMDETQDSNAQYGYVKQLILKDFINDVCNHLRFNYDDIHSFM